MTRPDMHQIPEDELGSAKMLGWVMLLSAIFYGALAVAGMTYGALKWWGWL